MSNEQGAVVTIEGEDGELYSCQILEVFEFEGGEYALLLRVSDDDLLIMRLVRRDDETIFEAIESEEEYERVIACAEEEKKIVGKGVINKRMKNFEDLIRISPPIWPGKKLEVQPGDLSLFAPMGIGIEGPLLIRPWDDPLKVLSDPPSKYYGYHPGSNHPFHNAPTNESSGG